MAKQPIRVIKGRAAAAVDSGLVYVFAGSAAPTGAPDAILFVPGAVPGEADHALHDGPETVHPIDLALMFAAGLAADCRAAAPNLEDVFVAATREAAT